MPRIGFLAHELEPLDIPDLVDGEKDAVQAVGRLVKEDGTVEAIDVPLPAPEEMTYEAEEPLSDDPNSPDNAVMTTRIRNYQWIQDRVENKNQQWAPMELIPTLATALKGALEKIEVLESTVAQLQADHAAMMTVVTLLLQILMTPVIDLKSVRL